MEDINALNVLPLKLLALKAEIPTARYLDLMVNEGPSNSTFSTSSSTALRALKQNTIHLNKMKNIYLGLLKLCSRHIHF